MGRHMGRYRRSRSEVHERYVESSLPRRMILPGCQTLACSKRWHAAGGRDVTPSGNLAQRLRTLCTAIGLAHVALHCRRSRPTPAMQSLMGEPSCSTARAEPMGYIAAAGSPEEGGHQAQQEHLRRPGVMRAVLKVRLTSRQPDFHTHVPVPAPSLAAPVPMFATFVS